MNIQQLRAETPGAEARIHLNNAGAGLMPQPVLQAMTDHLQLEAKEGGYEAAALRKDEIAAFYNTTAQLLDAEPRQIAFTVSATDAYNRALSSIPFQQEDVILTTNNDYVSNQIAFLQMRDRLGIRVLRAADLPEGGVDPDDVEKLIRQHRPRLVAVTHMPTNSGLIQPVETIGKLCLEYGCLYLVDACQSVGQLPLSVNRLHCDYLTATFRKFLRGPRGAGFLYVSDRVLKQQYAPFFLDLASAHWQGPDSYELVPGAQRFENWERAYALLLGSQAAVQYAMAIGLAPIAERVQHLSALLRSKLQDIPDLQILDRGAHLGGIVSVYIPGREPEQLKRQLYQDGINVSIAERSSALIDLDNKTVPWVLRLSPHYYNTEAEIERAVECFTVPTKRRKS